jgi:hypothetical protein
VKVLARVIFPASIPDESGSRARTPAPRLREEEVGRALAEDVVDQLHRLNAGELDGLQPLFHPLDAHPVKPDLAGLHHVVEQTEHLGLIEDVGRRTVQLQEVDGLDLQVLEAPFDEGGQVLLVVALGGLLGEPAPRLGGDVEGVLALAPQSGQQLLGVPVAIDIGRVEEVHPPIERPVQGRHRLVIGDRAPGPADGPGAEADPGNVPVGPTQCPIFHHSEANLTQPLEGRLDRVGAGELGSTDPVAGGSGPSQGPG